MAATLLTVLIVSVRSIATAMCMAGIGWVATQRKVLTREMAKGMSELTINFLIPCLLFSTVLNCNQDWSSKPCPDIKSSVAMAWPLLFFPFLNVGMGALLGKLVCLATRAPEDQRGVIICSVAFANSTGLPITLLALIRQSLPASSEIGVHDPLLFQSVYLVTYPALQWGVGAWLMGKRAEANPARGGALTVGDGLVAATPPQLLDDGSPRAQKPGAAGLLAAEVQPQQQRGRAATAALAWTGKVKDFCAASLKPPVIAALLGMLLAITPVRSWLVDTYDRDNSAPLEWSFNAIRNIGTAAVPVNMLILGETLSRSLAGARCPCSCCRTRRSAGSGAAAVSPRRSSAGVLFGITLSKLVLMPAFGILTTYVASLTALVPSDYDSSLYLVMMVVTATPTSNTLLVMATAAGQDTTMFGKAMLTQYAAAPVLLTLSVTAMVYLSMNVFDAHS